MIMLPGVRWRIMCAALAREARKAPVVLMSKVRRHSSDVMERAGVQPTTPAKQQRISRLPSWEAREAMAVVRAGSSVTLALMGRILAAGKLRVNDAISSLAASENARSRSPRPERPCSRSARAVTKARVPPPPVTISMCDRRLAR